MKKDRPTLISWFLRILETQSIRVRGKARLRILITFLTACVFSIPLTAQRGIAPNGYYPYSYFGSTFTGLLEATKGDSNEITLVYTNGTKSERFVGRLASTCTWKTKDGTVHTFDPSDVRKSPVLTAFYESITKKTGGQKTTENLVIAISLAELGGKKIPEGNRLIIFCSEERNLRFKVF